MNFKEGMLIIYNKRLKKSLSWNDLYKNKAEKKRAKYISLEEMPSGSATMDKINEASS